MDSRTPHCRAPQSRFGADVQQLDSDFPPKNQSYKLKIGDTVASPPTPIQGSESSIAGKEGLGVEKPPFLLTLESKNSHSPFGKTRKMGFSDPKRPFSG